MSEAVGTGPAAARGPAGSTGTAAGPRFFLVRRVTAAQDFDLFFVSAVATILIVRGALAATGWPQLGGGTIHFAHLMWGGLGMLIGFVLFMGMQGRLWTILATLAAGIGWGLFIDELGKFITSDNDYFFQPAVAIIYLSFVGLYFLFRWLGRLDRMGPETALVNSLDFTKEAVMHTMGRGAHDEALYLLGRADQADPLVQTLAAVVGQVQSPEARPNAFVRAWNALRAWWARLIGDRRFRWFVIASFIVTSVGEIAGLIVFKPTVEELGSMDIGGLIAGAVTGVLVLIGLVVWRRSRIDAYRWFERGALVAILVGEFFSFYHNQVAAIFGLVWLIIQLIVIRMTINAEFAGAAGAGADGEGAGRVRQPSFGGVHGAHQL